MNPGPGPVQPPVRDVAQAAIAACCKTGPWLVIAAFQLALAGMSARAADPVPAEVITGLVSYYDLGNHLSSANGTRVQASSRSSAAGALNDEQPLRGWVSEAPLAEGEYFTLTFTLPREQSLASLVLQPQVDSLGVTTAHMMELLVARPGGGGDLLSLGRFTLSQERAWHRVTFTPRTTSTVVLRVHSARDALPVGIGEVAAFSPEVDAAPHYDFALSEPKPKPEPEAAPAPAAPAKTTITPAQATVAQPVHAPEPVARAEPAPPQPRVKPKPVTDIRGIPEVINTGLLRINGKMVPLYGVRGAYEPQASKLTQFIRDREVVCKKKTADTFRCVLAGRDLSEAVLRNGAGWAGEGADEALKASEASARERGVGVWE